MRSDKRSEESVWIKQAGSLGCAYLIRTSIQIGMDGVDAKFAQPDKALVRNQNLKPELVSRKAGTSEPSVEELDLDPNI